MDVRRTDSWKDSIFVTRATKALTMTTSATTHVRAVAVKHASRPNVVPDLTNPLSTAQPATTILTVGTASPYTVQKNICKTLVRCGSCCKQFQPDPQQPHRCYFGKCSICKEYIDLREHKCYIQPIPKQENSPERKTKAKLKKHLKINPEASVYEEPPIFVYADYKAMISEDGTHLPICVCAQTSENNTSYTFYGDDCSKQFLEFLTNITEDQYKEPREVICIFHNLKGYDSIFIQHQLVIEGRKFDVMIPNGTKMISLEAGKITFKDSMAFLPMALSAFTDTFGLTELKKGFFPHKFHTQENRSYVGPLPEVSYYDPEGMSSKKKEEFEVWYREEAAKQHPFDLKEELLAYCHSDVALLKAGCHKFIQEFKSIAGFNPMEKCVTIAAACNRYWRRKHLPLDLIAVNLHQDGEVPVRHKFIQEFKNIAVTVGDPSSARFCLSCT